MVSYRRVIESLYYFVQKTGDDEALGDWHGNTPGAQIKKFVFIDLPGGCAVGATDIVSEDFEAGHRVRFGVIAQEKIANFLIGIGEMGVRFHPDEAAECATGTIIERVFVEEIAGGVGRDVILQRAGVEFLLIFRNRDRERIPLPAFAYEPAETFETRISRTQIQVKAHGRGIVIDRGRVHLQRDDILSPVLGAYVGHLRAGSSD